MITEAIKGAIGLGWLAWSSAGVIAGYIGADYGSERQAAVFGCAAACAVVIVWRGRP